MSQEKQNKETNKVLDKLSKALDLEALQENEAGELTGGFSDAISEEIAEDGIEINFSKCHCTGGTTTQS